MRDAILNRLRIGRPVSRSLVAKDLSTSERTLVRRLRERSTSFRRVLDDVRCALFQQLAAVRSASDDVALALGYTDRRSLSYALRRWS